MGLMGSAPDTVKAQDTVKALLLKGGAGALGGAGAGAGADQFDDSCDCQLSSVSEEGLCTMVDEDVLADCARCVQLSGGESLISEVLALI